ncbi:low temperature requirement protein A [Kitasatospora sp. NPDC088134]|uniref:low temperature requirement protein A n=1 Tax=Kitasatospora sp. NPDC088134 TaxID=3364071 RepID=UPI00381BA6A1
MSNTAPPAPGTETGGAETVDTETVDTEAVGAEVVGAEVEQRVSWAELFFDLVWVFAITQIAAALADTTTPGAVARTLLLLVPLWWGWTGVTLLGNLAGPAIDRTAGRLTLFALSGCGLLMAIAVPHAYGAQPWAFAGAGVLLRLVLAVAIHLKTRPRLGRWHPFSATLLLGGPLLLAGAACDGPGRTALWAAAALADLGCWSLLGRRLDAVRFETGHLPERFGLFVIIALGETVVAVGGQAARAPLDPPAATAVALAFVLIATLWWTYFHYGAPAARHSIRHSPSTARTVREVFTYAHAGYATAVIGVAVGLKKLVAHPFDHPHGPPALLLAPGVALYLFSFCYARLRMFGAVGVPRLLGALACTALAALAPVLPGAATAALATAVLLAVNAAEAWYVETGRPLPLLHPPVRRRSGSAAAATPRRRG